MKTAIAIAKAKLKNINTPSNPSDQVEDIEEEISKIGLGMLILLSGFLGFMGLITLILGYLNGKGVISALYNLLSSMV